MAAGRDTHAGLPSSVLSILPAMWLRAETYAACVVALAMASLTLMEPRSDALRGRLAGASSRDLRGGGGGGLDLGGAGW